MHLPSDGFSYLQLRVVSKNNTPWCSEGHEIYATQFELSANAEEEAADAPLPYVTYENENIIVSGDNFSYTFSTDDGTLICANVFGKELLNKPKTFNCWRAPTDNDNTHIKAGNVRDPWSYTTYFGNLEYTEHILKNIETYENENTFSIKGDYIFSVQGRNHIAEGTIEYIFSGDGRMKIVQNGKFSEKLPYWLPRYGYIWELDNNFSNIEYFGMGPGESYADKCNHATMGKYKYILDNEQYENPQESGSHNNTKWITVADNEGYGIKISGNFSFCASEYDIHNITEARHICELNKSNSVFIYTDFYMSGVGSKSVGGQVPDLNERINAGDEINFELIIKPYNTNQEDRL